ncbi:hypothetical protein TREMEDRAFT_62307 [Tremella mesenterica DSM 1558]|uniref:uncharacterized protein n=1 Tax=Tremella mesenterica (strain ATCC 24925 / CBS 8224 / DSM 1558 / NBRC 9311 / NRRL Y-6157 / RJB 2259-6 / UBC 559-6) TaxID=578456 RepID=UPI0003F49582|nr:uncharacterized protein TREMEDRAFT_62307 [Tremella mesenterica DSM 1558]EIW69440.1 hypothetical protein TREMEDRAFT_62307 [Tremella mesenterica DSM 1558]
MSHGLLSGHPPPSIEILQAWLDDHGAVINSHVEITESFDGWGIRATETIDEGDLVCMIPKTAVLSHRTSSLPLLAPPPTSVDGIEAHWPILQLSLAILHELRLDVDSPFFGYLQSLPRELILLPVFWSVKRIAGEDGRLGLLWLKGTEAERDMARRSSIGLGLNELNTFYQTHRLHLPSTRFHPSPSPFEAFYHTFALVSTRAFVIDLYHTVGLCPFADLLNHSSTPHTQLASDKDVCHICGSLPSCKHDLLNANDVPRRLEQVPPHTRKIMEETIDCVELKLERSVRGGEEIWNWYDDNIGDARSLVEWGFVGEDFADEGITWELSHVLGTDISLKRAYAGMIASGVIKDMMDNIDVEDPLVGLPDRMGLLSVSHEGQISGYLFAAVVIGRVLLDEVPGHTELAEVMRDSLEEIERRANANEFRGTDAEMSGQTKSNTNKGPLSPITGQVVKEIINLLETRLTKFHHSEHQVEDLYTIRDVNSLFRRQAAADGYHGSYSRTIFTRINFA